MGFAFLGLHARNAKSDTNRAAHSIPDVAFELRAAILGGPQIHGAGFGSLFAVPQTFQVLESRCQPLTGSIQSLLCCPSSYLGICKPSFELLYQKQCKNESNDDNDRYALLAWVCTLDISVNDSVHHLRQFQVGLYRMHHYAACCKLQQDC